MAKSRQRPLSLIPHAFCLLFIFLLCNVGCAFASATEVPALAPRQSTTPSTGGQTDFTCGPDKPCANHACCGVSGWCGYGPTYCGTGCQSNCNATSECGQYASTPGASCPLNVCCSPFGFCGTTADFCGTGCQSNCKQPKPSGGPTNTQKRIVGYWEAWNTQHACGTMSPGEIPVNMLTHLNVAFGYINSAFQVTNMDGLSTDIYKNVGNVKSRNPSLKLIIALGGWSFSDPGPWRSVFPTLVSSGANRATFITNLLGFLSEYGYDGVDFDWEYPGADDRGGSAEDGVNYTALVRELRAAIQASGKDYIVTFTAPTSYWYLRHFDVSNMVQYVDWVNLMSYDLHGVWDSSNPIGNQVLAHTNLTEIDLALDLFWRVNVDPGKIVLGLGFYGRTFQLTDASCWKPGCTFTGPGAAGQCTQTPGILSYREVNDILTSTGATAYLDKDAAARYLVYGNSSWVSYDDAVTIAAKVAYANKMGLAGLMIWAVDLDDAKQTALKAVTGGADGLGSVDNPFTLVDIKYLFPTEYLPPTGVTPKYGLINFGGLADSGSMDPGKTAFGFLLIAGDSFAVSNLRRRSGEPEPFVFLDCPAEVLDAPKNETQTARVVCLSADIEGCFQVMERGVEGTIVEMPDNCAGNSFARAISLEVAADQHIPSQVLGKRTATSQVFDFNFDFNFDLVRRDTNNTSLRMDYSNIAGYWNTLVDAPGIQSRSLKEPALVDRFFAPTSAGWVQRESSGINLQYNPADALVVKQDLSAPVFWQSVEECRVDGAEFSEGFGAYVLGSVDASFYYGLSIVATLEGGFKVKQANAVFDARGQTDLTYAIGGMGVIDITRAKKGNPAFNEGNPTGLGGHTVSAGNLNGWVTFEPYYQTTYQMATFNGSTSTNFANAAAPFDGLLSTRIVTDLGNFTTYFPPDGSTAYPNENDRQPNQIQIPSSNIMYSSSGHGGKIAIGTYLQLGLKIDIFLFSSLFKLSLALSDMSMVYNTMTQFTFYPDEAGQTVCTDYDVVTNVYQQIQGAEALGWSDWAEGTLAYDRQTPSEGAVCYPMLSGLGARKKREELRSRVAQLSGAAGHETSPARHAEEPGPTLQQLEERQIGSVGGMPGWEYRPGVAVNPNTYLGVGGNQFQVDEPKFKCQNCLGCEGEEEDAPPRCCGCQSMDYVWGYSDIPPCDSCADDDGTWPGVSLLRARDEELARNDTSPPAAPLWKEAEGEAGDEEDYEAGEASKLSKRAYGTATISIKRVTVCGAQFYGLGDYRYPAFPAPVTYPWDGIDGGRWDSISRYWGNLSSDCASWQITNRVQADTVFVGSNGATARAKYQTEHVFEGQMIGDFFSWWLDRGQVKNQQPTPITPQSRVPCQFTKDYILKGDAAFPWQLDGKKSPFIQLLLAELGSMAHPDRLTVMQARPNRKKGNIFGGDQPTSPATYGTMTQDEQLQSVKEMGLIFNYLNNAIVWNAFCGTYEAVHAHLGDFDTWYAANGQGVTIPRLQDEWRTYVRVALDSMVLRSRATFRFMYDNRRYVTTGSPPWQTKRANRSL